jgi:hypothetical protein
MVSRTKELCTLAPPFNAFLAPESDFMFKFLNRPKRQSTTAQTRDRCLYNFLSETPLDSSMSIII